MTLLNELLRFVSDDDVYHAGILMFRRQEFINIFVRFKFYWQNDCDKLSKHELIVVTLSKTDLSDALVIQNCCNTLIKHELITAALSKADLSDPLVIQNYVEYTWIDVCYTCCSTPKNRRYTCKTWIDYCDII